MWLLLVSCTLSHNLIIGRRELRNRHEVHRIHYECQGASVNFDGEKLYFRVVKWVTRWSGSREKRENQNGRLVDLKRKITQYIISKSWWAEAMEDGKKDRTDGLDLKTTKIEFIHSFLELAHFYVALPILSEL